jgi:Flp pilus assembly protein TadD
MKSKLLLLAALLATTLSATAADTPGSNPSVPTPTVADRLANARKAIAAKDWTVAMRELNVAVRDEPRNADVHNLLGYSWRKRSNPDITKAFEHYYTALKLDPRHKGAHEYIGEAYLMEKKPAEAEKHLAELEKICGNKTCEEYQDLAKSIADYKAKN